MTTRISVELVPRAVDPLVAEAASLADIAPWADTLNLPDLTRFPLRSWDAAAAVATALPGRASLIPHLRAVDFPDDQPLPFVDAVRAAGVKELLVVSGDETPDNPGPTDLLGTLRRMRAELPGVDLYVGLDPYRQGMADEMDYLHQKLEAGATGLFTQPFFDLQLLRTWAAVLHDDLPVWWGATTVTTQRSMDYWNRRNRAVFPTDFSLDLAVQRRFAEQVIELATERGQHVYLMPVRTAPADYLAGLHVAGW